MIEDNLKQDSNPNDNATPLLNLLEASKDSPLIEADPKSLDELMLRIEQTFNADPEQLTDEDIDANTAYFRSRRHLFAKLAKEKAEAEPKRKKTEQRLEYVDLEELKATADSIEL